MEPLEIMLVLGLVYVAYKSGAFTPFGITPGVGLGGAQPGPTSTLGIMSSTPPSVAMPPSFAASGPSSGSSTTGANVTGLAITSAGSVAGAAATAPASFAALGLTGAAAGAAVAGIGAAVAIAAALYMAHLQRVKQAKDENSAMNLGVQGVDSEMKQINAAYNSHQISAADTLNLLSQVMQHYWQLVGPHIQPGRNGCSTGAACPPWHTNACSGSIGAACCVGCYDLAGGPNPAVLNSFDGGDGSTPFYFGVQGAMVAVQHGGHLQTCMQGVVASKYGGANRNGYRLTWAQVGS